MKRALVVILVVLAASPALARGHGAGSTAPMCSTCAHKALCRFDALFSCHGSKKKPQPAAPRARIAHDDGTA